MRNYFFPLLCLFAVLPLGCANWNVVQQAEEEGAESLTSVAGLPTPEPMQLMAIDFVNALQQISGFSPAGITVQLLRDERSDPFTLFMQMALENRGYGVRWVDDGVGEYLLQYRHVREASSGSSHRDVYEVAVGKVEMRRSYVLDESDHIRPVTPLYVRGTDASNVVLNDEIFEPDQVSGLSSSGAGAVAVPVPLKPAIPKARAAGTGSTNATAALAIENQSPLAVPDEANPLQGLVSNASQANRLTLPLIALPRVENVFELGGSNYEDVLAGHSMVDEQILTFPNDSLRLGLLNKQSVERMVLRFDPASDVFSLIGCSLGPTQIKGGNAALALGRASRVREALLFAGVSQDKILDEGCWAGDSSDNTLPRRGVVVTLNRKI